MNKEAERNDKATPCLSPPNNLLYLSCPLQTAVLGAMSTIDGNNQTSSSISFTPSSIISSTMCFIDKTDDNNNGKNILNLAQKLAD